MKPKIRAQVSTNPGGTTSFWGTATVSVSSRSTIMLALDIVSLHQDMQELLNKVDGVLLHSKRDKEPRFY